MITAPILASGLTCLARNASSCFLLSAVSSVLLNAMPCSSILSSTFMNLGLGFGFGFASGLASGFGFGAGLAAGFGFGAGLTAGFGFGHRSGVHCLQAAAGAGRAGGHAPGRARRP